MGRARKWESNADRMRAKRGGTPPGIPDEELAEDGPIPPASPGPPPIEKSQFGSGDEIEVAPDGTVLRSRFGTREAYIARGRALAFPASEPHRAGDGTTDPGTPAIVFQERAERYAAWRWDGFHRGEVASL